LDRVTIHNLHKSFKLQRGRPGSLKGLLLSFRGNTCEELHTLKGINLSVRSGETVAVVGKNGSGKSTLLGIVARVYKPTSGKVEVNGRLSSLLDLGAGFHPDLTGIENIYLNGSILGLRRKELKERMDKIIEFSELGNFIDAPIRTYSNGMIMRLGFSIATQIDPDILLVDEVLAVGDEIFQHKCYNKVKEFQKQGKTIIFVSHDLKAVAEVANRTVWLDAGVIRADGDTDSVLKSYLESSCGQQ
jgi:ABC-type polysaccharide/polyol phosphate transport system ATPase subunit